MGKGAERDSGEVSGRAMRLQSRVPYVHIHIKRIFDVCGYGFTIWIGSQQKNPRIARLLRVDNQATPKSRDKAECYCATLQR